MKWPKYSGTAEPDNCGIVEPAIRVAECGKIGDECGRAESAQKGTECGKDNGEQSVSRSEPT